MVLVALAAASPAVAQDATGHYRFRVLDPAGDSVVADGEFVLGGEAFGAPDVPADLLDRVVQDSHWLTLRDAELTTCFAVRSSPAYFQGREFYPGIVENGVSDWSLGPDGRVVIPLYRSPDASAALVGRVEGNHIVGRVNQSDWNPASANPIEWLPFEAERVGDATPEACANVLTLPTTRRG